MTRKGTVDRSPQSNVGVNESAIDKATKKVKEVFDGDNEEPITMTLSMMQRTIGRKNNLEKIVSLLSRKHSRLFTTIFYAY